MPDPIPKHLKDRDDWSVEQTIAFARTGELPLNPEYVKRRNQALEDAGLEPDQDESTPIEAMTVEQLAKRMRKG